MVSNISCKWRSITLRTDLGQPVSWLRSFWYGEHEDVGTNREREHAERMLKRAQRQQVRAAKLVEKWQTRIANLDRAGVAAIQPRLWSDESDTITRQRR